MACTTILAGKLATADGSTLVARNEDFGHAYNPKRYEAAIEEMKQNTIAAGRHILLTTDVDAAGLDGEALENKLTAANDQIAAQAHKLAMKCLGSMVETGSLQIRLNY